MNLLARILSHGFALAVVVLIAIALMYRGDLFPEWELPEFLVVEDKSGTVTEGTPATVDSTLPEAAATSPEATAGVPAEAPQVEVAGDVETQGVVSPAEEVVAGTADTLPETSPAAAIVDDTAGPETALEVPEVAVPDSTPETDTAVGADAPASVPDAPDAPDEHDATVPQQPRDGDQGQADEAQAVPSATVTASEVVKEQLESSVPDMTPFTPVTEPVAEPEPESAAADAPAVPSATVTDSEKVAELPESPLPDMAPSTPATEPVASPEPAVADAPVAPTETVTAGEAMTEQPESPAPDVTPPVLATEQVADSEPESAVAEAPAAALESHTEKSAYESLAAAREAYWLHDYAGAENHYRLLIELEPDNPDWHGELGNMYFAQGQWEQAAAAYYEAGVRLLSDGLVAQARQMVNVIRGLNGAGADDLEARINSVDRISQ